jgi:hypothetical protein
MTNALISRAILLPLVSNDDVTIRREIGHDANDADECRAEIKCSTCAADGYTNFDVACDFVALALALGVLGSRWVNPACIETQRYHTLRDCPKPWCTLCKCSGHGRSQCNINQLQECPKCHRLNHNGVAKLAHCNWTPTLRHTIQWYELGDYMC